MTIDIAAIRARLEKATSGPWKHYSGKLRDQFANTIHEVQSEDGRPVVAWGGFDAAPQSPGKRAANARFIAHAPADIAALLAEVERLQEALDAEKARTDDQLRMFAEQTHSYNKLTNDLIEKHADKITAATKNPAIGLLTALIEHDGGEGSKDYHALKYYDARQAVLKYLAERTHDLEVERLDRNAVVEECARVADEAEVSQENSNGAANTGGAAQAAEAIRALKV